MRRREHLAAFQPKRPPHRHWLRWLLLVWIAGVTIFFACQSHSDPGPVGFQPKARPESKQAGPDSLQAAQSNPEGHHGPDLEVVDQLHHGQVQRAGGSGRFPDVGPGGGVRRYGQRLAEIACPPMPGDELAFPWRSLYLCPILARMDELARAERE